MALPPGPSVVDPSMAEVDPARKRAHGRPPPEPNVANSTRLRVCREITASRWLLVWSYAVVPFAVEFVAADVDRLHLLVGDLQTLRIQEMQAINISRDEF